MYSRGIGSSFNGKLNSVSSLQCQYNEFPKDLSRYEYGPKTTFTSQFESKQSPTSSALLHAAHFIVFNRNVFTSFQICLVLCVMELNLSTTSV